MTGEFDRKMNDREDEPATGCCTLREDEAAGAGCCGRRKTFADEVAATAASWLDVGISGRSLGNNPKSRLKGGL